MWPVVESDLRLHVELTRKTAVAGSVATLEDAELAKVANHLEPLVGTDAREPSIPRGSRIERLPPHFPWQRSVHDDVVVLVAQHVVGDPRRPKGGQERIVLLVVAGTAARAVCLPRNGEPPRQIAWAMGEERTLLAGRNSRRELIPVIGLRLTGGPRSDSE